MLSKKRCDSTPSGCQPYVSSAKGLLAEQDYAEALHVVQFGLQEYPDNPDLLLVACDICQVNGDCESGAQYAHQLLEHHPAKWQGYVFAAKSLLALNAIPRAKEVVLSGLLVVPEEFNTLVIASRVLVLSNDFTAAFGCAQRLIELYPQKWQGYMWAAKVRFATGRYAAALEHVNSALLLQPNRAGLLRLAADIARADDRREDSLEQNKKLSGIAGHEWVGSIRVAEDLVANHLFGDAQKVMRAAIEKNFADYEPPDQAQQRKYELWRHSVETCVNCHQNLNATQYTDITAFQYWSQGQQPKIFQKITDRWSTLLEKAGIGRVELFSRESAIEWMQKHSPEFLTPFQTAYHYAMEADIFRLAFSSQRDSIYIDSVCSLRKARYMCLAKL